MSRIAVIGTGYVGLTTGAYLAHLGHTVVCADVVPAKVECLNRGEIPIVESGLQPLVQEGLGNGRLSFVLGGISAVSGAEFVFLCLPTPQDEDGSADLTYVQAAAAEIGPHLAPGSIVINKSTVPVGSVEMVADIIARDDIAVVSNPEFLREGSAVHDCLHPDRIVIGSEDRAAAERVAALYSALDTAMLITDAASAEMIKYASNAFLATKISFVNAVANLCEAVGADVSQVVQGMALDSRINPQFLNPGPGWGGSCFPKDTRAFIRIAEDVGCDFMLLRGVVAANTAQQDTVARKVERMVGGSLTGVRVAVWGLAFKAGTDDLRDSPSLAVIDRLLARGASVRAFDPAVSGPVDGIDVVSDPYAACDGADILVILTEWPLFAELDMVKVGELLASPRIVDARNVLNPVYLSMLGFAYEGIGRRGLIDASELDSFDVEGLGQIGSAA
jgi:UDPglucose 6-dehydrogenase